MRYIRIFFIAFALLAFLSQGDSLPTGHRREEATSTGLPLESKVTTDDITGHGPLISGIRSPNAPTRAAKRRLKVTNHENTSDDLKNPQPGTIEDGGFSLKTTSDPDLYEGDEVKGASIDGKGNLPNVSNRAKKRAFLNTNKGTKSRKVSTLPTGSDINTIRIPEKIARILKSMVIMSKLSTKSNVDNKGELADEKRALVDKLATTDQPVEPGTDEPTNPLSKLKRHVDGVSPDLKRETTTSQEISDFDIAEEQFNDDSEFGDGKSPLELGPRVGSKLSADGVLQKEEPLNNKTEAEVQGSGEPSNEQLQGNGRFSRKIFPKKHALKGIQKERSLEDKSGFAKLKRGSSAHAPKIASKDAFLFTKIRAKARKIKSLLANSNRTGIRFSWNIPRFLKSKLEISEPPNKENVEGKNHLVKAKGARVLKPGKWASHKERRINEISSELQSNLTNVKGARTLKPGKRVSHKEHGINKVSSELQSHFTNAKGAHGNKTGKWTSQKKKQIDRVNTFSQGMSDLEITHDLVDDSAFGHEKNPTEQAPSNVFKTSGEDVFLTEESLDNIGSGGEINVAAIKRVESSSNGASGTDGKQRISHHISRKASEEVLRNSKEETKASKVKALLSSTNTPGSRFSGTIPRHLKMRLRIPEQSAKVDRDNPSPKVKGAQNDMKAAVDQSVDPEIAKPGDLGSQQGRHVKEVYPGLQGNSDLATADEVIHKTSELVSNAVLNPTAKEVPETGDYLKGEEDTDWGSGDSSSVEETLESTGSGDITYEKITPNADSDFTIDFDSGGGNGGKYLSKDDSSREGQAVSQFSRRLSDDDASTRESDFHWKGFAMARARRRDRAPDQFGKTEGGILGYAVTTLSLVFLLGGSMLVLLFGIVLLVVIWPIRKYYDYLVVSMDRQDVEKGECGDELSSIRVDAENPSERPSGTGSSVNYSQRSQQGKTFVPIYHYPGDTRVGYEHPHYSGETIYSLRKGISGERDRKSPNKVASEVKKRDPRNAERRKIIRRQTFEKRGSLVDSLMTAKNVIDDHAKNKEFEEKALERRQKIKEYSADLGLQAIGNNRRMSFAEEVQSACTVINRDWIDKEKMEKSKEKRQKIRQRISSKKRPSLLDQIEVAKDLIVPSDKMYSQEMS